MTLTERIRKMVIENYRGGDGIKIHPIHKYLYINVKMERTMNYIAFRKWWNEKIQGRIVDIGLSNKTKFVVSIGAISKNTNDILTLKFVRF